MSLFRRSLFPTLSASLVLMVCLVATACAQDSPLSAAKEAVEGPTLGIGSKAPPLDIEYWIQDAGGKLKPVESFKKGKVYVVEFWATWCGPCIQSMPHLAELQQRYAKSVRLVSVTDETLDEVKALMQQDYPGMEKTFDQVTSGYSLTADPDGSTHESYMQAAQIGGIPSAFLVGKTGLVEWIGHPMAIDEPLEAVLDDTWDREAEKQRRQREMRRQEVTRKMALLARQGNYDAALELVQKQLEETPPSDDADRNYWESVVNSLKMSAGKLDDDAIKYFREQLGVMDGDPMSLIRFSFSLFDVADGGGDVGPLAKETDAELAKVRGEIEEGSEPLYHYARALLNRIDADFDAAIAQLQKAVDTAGGKQKERFAEALEEMKADAKKSGVGGAEEEAKEKE